MEYGTGAVMAVPAHDQRDFEFAKKYNLPIRMVIQPADKDKIHEEMNEAYVGDGVQVNSSQFDGMPNREAIPRIIEFFEDKGIGESSVNYRLRDWLISRQRYWGNPIPVIYCDDCGTVPVPDSDLPVILPSAGLKPNTLTRVIRAILAAQAFTPSEVRKSARPQRLILSLLQPKVRVIQCGLPGRRPRKSTTWAFISIEPGAHGVPLPGSPTN